MELCSDDVVTLVAKEPTPYPEDHGFVQRYQVEMVHQISKESTLSPAGYGAVYCRKWLTIFRRNLLHLQHILKSCIVTKV
jgi:hypothetical protein